VAHSTGEIYQTAWHGQQPYNAKEEVRLRKACDMMQSDAKSCNLSRRYRVLDIGCGVGPLRKWLPEEKFEIDGLDFCAEALDLARKNYDHCILVDAETSWPTDHGQYDAVHAGAILEHVVDWHAPLNQATNVLADDGLLVISTPNLCYWKAFRKLVRGRQPHWTANMEHLHVYAPRFLKDLLTLHGFEVLDMTADRLGISWIDRNDRVCHKLACAGSVLILSARLRKRVRIEDISRACQHPNHVKLKMHSIEVLE
jgi:2-polyprenyl-3-methyl-5-hydroxy-6-metoxy-1,4-benzoquinol methylase